MANTLFKQVDYSLSKLLGDIEMGEIALPEIQRPFVWPNKKIRDLFDSMYRGFPVGYLLFWQTGADKGTKQIGVDAKQLPANLMIVDGQQRLTSLYAVIKNHKVIREDFSEEKIQIAFNPLNESFEVPDAAINRNPHFIKDISVVWSEETDIFTLVEEYLSALKQSQDVSTDQERKIKIAISNLKSLESYPFTALELAHTLDEEAVAEVFVRINSKGKNLNQADFILTIMSVYWDKGRHDLEKFSRESQRPSVSGPSSFNYFIQPDPGQLLRVSVGLGFRRARLLYVYSILRGKDLDTGVFSEATRNKQFDIFKAAQTYALDLQNWHEFLKTLLNAGFKGSGMISSRTALLYSYVMYLIGKRDYQVDAFELRKTISRWFFMATLSARYSTSPETQMESDLNDLREVKTAAEFLTYLNNAIDNKLTEDFWNINLVTELATSSSRSPSLFGYYASLNLLGANVLFSKIKVSELLDPATRAKKAALERHHLFPKAYLKKHGIATDRRETNQIANYALLEWSDNIGISDSGPAEYLPIYAERFAPDELTEMKEMHALPAGWENMEYAAFLRERRQLMARIIRKGFAKLSN